ncbi:unnamed protein product [Eruca vesicaria subsp. sativa]|uniref:Pentatricopeptide repeat-containing protein n=1 Tax=Eruca vesicaria subsp. sativa TaxID=29727 RepID=A0ABC8LFN7_ERUVS|nr:unnamed protein product [Eruca vesicaria subsp. sativa]
MLCRRLVLVPRFTLSPVRTPLLSCFLCERGYSGGCDRKISSSYKERLRSGIIGIKKDDAVALFQTMIESRPLPTVIDFSRLFSAVARTKQYDLVLDLCRQMELKGIAHDNYTLSIVINCFCRRRKRFCLFCYGKDVEAWVIPDLIILNTIVNGLSLQDRLSEAMSLIDRMMVIGCQPDQFTYGPVLNRMCKSGNIALALGLLRKMECRKIANTVTYSTLIQGFCQSGKLNMAKELFQEMVSEGVHPDIVTYSILLDGLCDNGELEEALGILDKMHKSKMELDIGIYSIIIHGMCNASKVDDAWDLFCSLPSKGVKPDVKTYTIMIGGLCKKGSLAEANTLLRKMEEEGIAPDSGPYNTLIRAHLRDGDLTESAELIEEMKSCGFSADASTIKIVMDMLSDGRMKKSFLDMLS